MKNMLFLLAMLFCSALYLTSLSAQTDRIYSQDKLPIDYTMSSQERYEQTLKNHNLSLESNREDSDRQSYFLETTYVIDYLLKSGYILYNDPIGDYVNSVLDVILEENPELRENNPRVYIFRSTVVNAFAVDRGIIFISLGLLSQLENEAQLAVILSHELVHIEENHGLEEFLKATEVDRSFNKRSRSSGSEIDIANLEKNRFSREQEIEADEKGLAYFLNTDYDFSSVDRIFDILRYSYLPYDEIPFKKSVLEKISSEIPEGYLLEEVKFISPEEEDEEQSTHPALTSRTNYFHKTLKNEEVTTQQVYLVSEPLFKSIQQNTRKELARLFLEQQRYEEAIYSGFLMTELYGEDDFSREIIGEALYALSKFKTNDQEDDLDTPFYKDIEGESQQVYHLMFQLDAYETALIAIGYNYDRYEKTPDNENIKKLLVDLFADLSIEHETTSLNNFYIIEDEEEVDSSAVEKVKKKKSKLDRIKKPKKSKDAVKWDRLVFSDVLEDPDFISIAEEGFEKAKAVKEEYVSYDDDTYEGQQNYYDLEKKIKNHGYSLGIEKVVIVNPTFVHLKGNTYEYQSGYIESDQRREALKEIIKSSAELNEVEIQVLDAHTLTENDVDILNDITICNEYIHAQSNTNGFFYFSFNQDEIDTFIEKYETPYVMAVTVISLQSRFKLASFLNMGSKSLFFITLYDVRNGKTATIKSDYSNHYVNDIFLKSEFYDAFHQISKTDK